MQGATGTSYLQFALANPAHFEVMWRHDVLRRGDPALGAASYATFDQLLTSVRAAQADGLVAGVDERSVAYLAWASVHGLAVLWLNGPLSGLDQRPFDEIARSVGTLLDASLAAYAAPTPSQQGDSDA